MNLWFELQLQVAQSLRVGTGGQDAEKSGIWS